MTHDDETDYDEDNGSGEHDKDEGDEYMSVHDNEYSMGDNNEEIAPATRARSTCKTKKRTRHE